jgi:hypothetical protein
MVRAVEKVRERLLRATKALESAGVPYAVVGGNAVAVWVARVDPGAVRNTADVDLLVRRADLPAAKAALAAAGFVHQEVAGVEMFLDGPSAGPREALHLLFANEKVRPEEVGANPDVAEAAAGENYRVLSLDALVRMKLNSFRLKDRVHILDMIGVGLIDASWLPGLPPELATRLKELLDNPQG